MKQFIQSFVIIASILCVIPLNAQRAKTSNTDNTQLYKFLDFYHDGTQESFLRGIKKSNVLVLRENQNPNKNSAKVVNTIGAEWGLSIRTNPYGKVTEVVLITSNTSQKIFTRAKTELNPYLGKPSEIDSDERIKWDTQNIFAHFRHLHSDEGGWTIIFKIYYP